MPLVFLPLAWILTAAGRAIVARFCVPATAPERNLTGFALGLGVFAYGMLALGLLGLLTPGPALILVALLALVGGREHVAMAREVGERLRAGAGLRGRDWGIAALFAVFGLISLAGVFTPPTQRFEWDSLAYHLADPQLYVRAHRIYYLPWESHSNFAFTTEMWYAFGLLLNSVPLAKLFHFACGAGTCLAIYAFGARHLTARTGVWAPLLFASTPLAFWEAGTAYVDLSATFFATLTLLALASGMRERHEGWLGLAAVLMGFTLSTKATALTILAVFALALLVWRLRGPGEPAGRAVGRTAVWCVVALVVGCPWYVKSWALTGNPVYPFYYHIFGGRYWDAANAAAYDASNAAFGMGHRPLEALLVPWNLTMFLLPGHPIDPLKPKLSFNDYQIPWQTLTPVFLAALFFPAFARGSSAAVRALGAYALASLLFWFATAQYVRYLLPAVPVFCLLCAWVLGRALSGRWMSGYALAALTACSFALALYLSAVWLLPYELPVVLGRESRDAYLGHNYSAFRAMQWANANLPPDAKVVFYNEPSGFGWERPYLWGDAGHSTYIPYGQLQTPDDLNRYLHGLGVTHMLINFNYFPPAPGYAALVYGLARECGPPVSDNGHNVLLFALPPAPPKP